MAFLSFRRTPDRGPGQAPESSDSDHASGRFAGANQIKTLLDTGFHRCDDFCKSLYSQIVILNASITTLIKLS
ncbi:MAG: hypothetical protein Q8O04_04585 [Deltaproteobacteria bacterium]|nr:hypothetical protein [Deltaproteobacteria bacterium]